MPTFCSGDRVRSSKPEGIEDPVHSFGNSLLFLWSWSPSRNALLGTMSKAMAKGHH